MANMVKKCAADCEVEQKKIEKTVSTHTPIAEENRTTLSLSLTVRDKKTLKMMAIEQETTIAAIIHGWIVEHQKGVDK